MTKCKSIKRKVWERMHHYLKHLQGKKSVHCVLYLFFTCARTASTRFWYWVRHGYLSSTLACKSYCSWFNCCWLATVTAVGETAHDMAVGRFWVAVSGTFTEITDWFSVLAHFHIVHCFEVANCTVEFTKHKSRCTGLAHATEASLVSWCCQKNTKIEMHDREYFPKDRNITRLTKRKGMCFRCWNIFHIWVKN